MMTADDVLNIYHLLDANDIWLCLNGGWGIDALLGEQTRAHKDLDIFMLVDDVALLRELLEGNGYTLQYPWEENIAVVDADGAEVLSAFVLGDSQGHQVDIHALQLDESGNGIPAWANEGGLVFSQDDISWQGAIAGEEVVCQSPASQVACHQGYILPSEQQCDLVRLRERFGLSRRQ
ncbi:MAG: nucleotidyltransferase domain-containing protein [Anaerolineae bacterium]